MYYNQYLKSYVILSRDLFDLESIDDFIKEAEKHTEFLLKYHSISFDLELLKEIKKAEKTELGENLYSEYLIERLKAESNVWCEAYIKYMERKSNDYWAEQKDMIFYMHSLMRFMHSTFNIGVDPRYITRHVIKK